MRAADDSVSVLDNASSDFGYGAGVFCNSAGSGSNTTGTRVDVGFTSGYVARPAA